jgi:hypothetical protein
MKVDIKCQGSHEIELKDLTILQGNLKSLSEKNYKKLKKEILELGYSSPIHVWNREGTHYILDGTQRTRTLTKMSEEGYEIPPLPVVRVEASSFDDAKRKVLALTSQYGKIENDGLYEFISDSDITVDYIEESYHFPEVNIDKFKQEFYEPTLEEDLGQDIPEDKEYLIVCEMGNEHEQSALFEQLTKQGIKCKLM